ncbi:MAG TPA: STAS domain-containing protein [Herpetosiphonaceae bacterium]|nr:STAS domain-containing protein [Herpetosiphonaceae bacterium]
MIFLDDETTQLKRFQSFCVWLVVAALAIGASEIVFGLISNTSLMIIGSPLVGLCALGGVWARWRSRRHSLTRTVIQLCTLLLAVLIASTFVFPALWPMFVVATIMVVIVALPYVGGAALRNLLGSAFAGALAITLLGNFLGTPAGFSDPPRWITVSLVIVGIVSGTALIILLLWQFSQRLQEIVGQLRQSNAALERERGQLERQVVERTADLSATVETIKEREADLARTLDQLHANQQTLRAVSAPIIPVLPGVIIAPLIGEIDAERTAVIAEHVLQAVQHERARYVILDMTGIPFVDDAIAQSILNMTAAVRLLGAQVLLAGIRPEVAQTMVARSLDLTGTRSYANLREAVRVLV